MKRTSPTRQGPPGRMIMLAAVLLSLAAAARAGPQGAKVVRGRVQFTQQGDTLLIRASNNSIINFRSFNIPEGQTVRYVLPSASSRVLNRVTGGQASQIDGLLLCNGRLYLVNPAGVFFGPRSEVSAAAIYAAAGYIADRDFLRNVNRFGGITGAIVNEGCLQGQAVNLIARQVTNSGSIVAPNGIVTMTAANGEVSLGVRDEHIFVKIQAAPADSPVTGDPALVSPTSPLAAGDIYSLAVQNTGQVKGRDIAIGGDGAKVDVSGLIDASQAGGQGGAVSIGGDCITVTRATVDVSGRNGGGDIEIGSAAAAGSRVFVLGDASLNADATARGDGGCIVIRTDKLTSVDGALAARGGPAGGNGGYVDTSGGVLGVSQAPDVSAVKGRNGVWLLDPHDAQIVDGALPWRIDDPQQALAHGFVVDNSGYWNIQPSAQASDVSTLSLDVILSGLMRAQTVMVRTSSGGNGKGDITWTMSAQRRLDLDTLGSQDLPPGFRRLVLEAHNDINIDFNRTIQEEHSEHGSLQLVLIPDFDRKGGGQVRMNTDFYRVVTGGLSKAFSIAVPPSAPNLSLKDIVILRAASSAGVTLPTNPVAADRSSDTVSPGQNVYSDSIKKSDHTSTSDSIQVKLAESGAMDATNTVNVRRTSATSRPSIGAGDAIGMRTRALRVP